MRTLLKRAIGATSVCVLAAGMVFGAHALIKNDGAKYALPIQVLTNQTWHFNGGPSDLPTDASKYTLTPGEPCDENPETVCELNAPASAVNPGQPDLSAMISIAGQPAQSISQRITAALSSSTPNETVTAFRSK
ncbi:hypothetical protein D3C87_1277740 [compost metagenome]|uniref:hypothetical protein n=1 Tax=Sphingobacterium faecium TaxID=34087 RepID=UPI000FC01F98|nr:hypothetical protein [Sphingobacterium faecium]MQP26772.1 hypothetical protein [Sphingobacterium faecium]